MILFLSIFLIAWSGAAGQTREIDAGVVTRRGDRDDLRVSVSSSNARWTAILRTAFAAHGAFSLVAEESGADFRFRADPAGTNGARLTITSGDPPRVLLNEVIGGGSPNDAVLRAADRAVERTTGLRGIFAGRLVFIGERAGTHELYLADLLFTESRALTADRSKALSPAQSPDGRMILYTSYHRGAPDIYAIDLATNRRSVFLSRSGTNTGATFSPDGSRVACVLSGTGNAEIYLTDPTASGLRRITRNNSLEAEPSFSPDGNTMVFTSDQAGKPQLYTMPAGGGAMRRIPTNISGYCAEPNWNPVDPNRIAFTVAAGREFEVCLWDFESGRSTILTEGAGDAVEPAWTRDGRHLVYTERRGSNQRLILLDTETRQKRALHDGALGKTSQAHYIYLAR